MILAGMALVTACTPKEGIEVRDAWIRTAPQGGNSALYFVIHNYSADDELVGVSTEIADAAEMHESSMVDDVMQMRMVESVPLVSGEDAEFASGGLHVMLVGLKEEAKVRRYGGYRPSLQEQRGYSVASPCAGERGRAWQAWRVRRL